MACHTILRSHIFNVHVALSDGTKCVRKSVLKEPYSFLQKLSLSVHFCVGCRKCYLKFSMTLFTLPLTHCQGWGRTYHLKFGMLLFILSHCHFAKGVENYQLKFDTTILTPCPSHFQGKFDVMAGHLEHHSVVFLFFSLITMDFLNCSIMEISIDQKQ